MHASEASKEGRELIVSDNEKAIIQKRKFQRGVDDQSVKKSWVSCILDVHSAAERGYQESD